MIEWRDRADRLDRVTLRINPPFLALRADIAGEDLPVVDHRSLRGEIEDVERAAGLVQRVLLGKAGFGGDEIGDLLTALGNDLGGSAQHLRPFVTRKR